MLNGTNPKSWLSAMEATANALIKPYMSQKLRRHHAGMIRRFLQIAGENKPMNPLLGMCGQLWGGNVTQTQRLLIAAQLHTEMAHFAAANGLMHSALENMQKASSWLEDNLKQKPQRKNLTWMITRNILAEKFIESAAQMIVYVNALRKQHREVNVTAIDQISNVIRFAQKQHPDQATLLAGNLAELIKKGAPASPWLESAYPELFEAKQPVNAEVVYTYGPDDPVTAELFAEPLVAGL